MIFEERERVREHAVGVLVHFYVCVCTRSHGCMCLSVRMLLVLFEHSRRQQTPCVMQGGNKLSEVTVSQSKPHAFVLAKCLSFTNVMY